MCTACSYSLSATPEEDATKTLMEWAKNKRLLDKGGARLFGRNTFPTDKPEPRGYELHLTIDENLKTNADTETSEVPAGLYAVLRFRDLRNINLAWEKLWLWIEKSVYEQAGWYKGNHGWVNGFEEQVNWQEQKPPTEWIFDLWVQLKE